MEILELKKREEWERDSPLMPCQEKEKKRRGIAKRKGNS